MVKYFEYILLTMFGSVNTVMQDHSYKRNEDVTFLFLFVNAFFLLYRQRWLQIENDKVDNYIESLVPKRP